MVLHHPGKCTDHYQIASGSLGVVASAGHFDTILYSWLDGLSGLH